MTNSIRKKPIALAITEAIYGEEIRQIDREVNFKINKLNEVVKRRDLLVTGRK